MQKLIRNLTLLTVFCCFASLFNQAKAVDLGEIELNKIYNIDSYSSVTATFTAPSTGILIQEGVPDIEIAGVEKEFASYGEFGQIYTYHVTEGQTYTLGCSFVMQGGKVRWSMEGANSLAVSEILPPEGSVISPLVNYTGDIVVRFNARVIAESASLCIGSTNMPLTIVEQGTTQLIVNVKHTLEAMYNNGTLKETGGENIELRFTGVGLPDGTLYNNDGILSITYKTAPKTLNIVSTNFENGRQLKSYYPEGDANGILKFTFDGQLINDGKTEFELSCGNPESVSAYYTEQILPTVSGSVVTVDLTGKLRELNPYLDKTDFKFVSVKLSNVRDKNGNFTMGDSDANIGSYSYNFTYEYIEPVTISSEFTPASGSSLAGVDQIEIWFNNANMVTFDGVKFDCADATVVVPLNKLTITTEGNDKVILVDVPEQIKGKTAVTVTLNNFVALDGYDHTRDICAVYDSFVVRLVSPIQDGGSYATTGEDDFVFTVNEAYGYMRYDLYAGSEWVYGSWFNEAGDGTYTAFNNNWPLYKDVDNIMIVRCWNEEANYWEGQPALAQATMRFNGLTQPFTYSDVKFVSIDPEPNTQIVPTDDFCFTLTFDGLVDISSKSCINTGFGSSIPFAKIIAVDAEETSQLSNVWKLYPSAADLTGTSIDISVYAYDELGKLVEGNMGGEEFDYLQFSYTVYNTANFKPLTISPADGATVAELTAFEVSYAGKAVGINYNYEGDMPYIMNKVREIVYTFSYQDLETYAEATGTDEDGETVYDENTVIYMNLSTPISDEGAYSLIIPENFFIIGSQFESYGSEMLFATYFIEGEPVQKEDVELTLIPEPGTVITIEKIEIDAPGIKDAIAASDEDITISDAEGNVIFTTTAFDLNNSSFDWSTLSFVGFFIDLGENAITKAGAYTVEIPDHFFEFMDMSYSKALTGIYTVSGIDGVSSIWIETADNYVVYNLNGAKVMSTANAADLATLHKGIYIINGKKVMIK